MAGPYTRFSVVESAALQTLPAIRLDAHTFIVKLQASAPSNGLILYSAQRINIARSPSNLIRLTNLKPKPLTS